MEQQGLYLQIENNQNSLIKYCCKVLILICYSEARKYEIYILFWASQWMDLMAVFRSIYLNWKATSSLEVVGIAEMRKRPQLEEFYGFTVLCMGRKKLQTTQHEDHFHLHKGLFNGYQGSFQWTQDYKLRLRKITLFLSNNVAKTIFCYVNYCTYLVTN